MTEPFRLPDRKNNYCSVDVNGDCKVDLISEAFNEGFNYCLDIIVELNKGDKCGE